MSQPLLTPPKTPSSSQSTECVKPVSSSSQSIACVKHKLNIDTHETWKELKLHTLCGYVPDEDLLQISDDLLWKGTQDNDNEVENITTNDEEKDKN